MAHYALGEIFLEQYLADERPFTASGVQYACVLANAPPDLRAELRMDLRNEFTYYLENEELAPEQAEQLRKAIQNLSGDFEAPELEPGTVSPNALQGCDALRG